MLDILDAKIKHTVGKTSFGHDGEIDPLPGLMEQPVIVLKMKIMNRIQILFLMAGLFVTERDILLL